MYHEATMLGDSKGKIAVFVVGVAFKVFVEPVLVKQRASERHAESGEPLDSDGMICLRTVRKRSLTG